MVHLLISIKPKWAEHILQGTKKWEFRKHIPKVELGTRIILYSTKPRHEIIGEFTIDQIIKAELNELIGKTLHETPHTEEELRRYFARTNVGIAIKVGNKIRYKRPISLEELKKYIKQPPMSSMYIKDEDEKHKELLELIQERN